MEPTIVGEEPGRFMLSHTGVDLGLSPLSGMRRVALFWIACDNRRVVGGSCDFRGRAIELIFPRPMFLGVWEPATGQPAAGGGPVRIVPGNANFLNSLSATVTSQGILLAWVRIAPEHGGSTQLLVETTLLDDTFRVLRDIETVYRRDGLRELVAYGQTALAFEPENETVLLLFPDRDEQEISRRYGILLGPDGLPKPGAEPFRTGFDFGEEVATSAVALPGKGFFITLEKEDSTGTSISGMAIDNDGTPAFLNPVCGAKSFQINTVNQGFQQRPSIARLTNAALQVVWSDRSESFGDPSGSAVRGRLLGSHNLFPVESQ